MINKIKKILSIIVLVSISLTLLSCSKDEKITNIPIKETTEFVKQNNIDKTFNIAVIEFFDSDMDHSAYHGFFDYLKENNVKYNIVYDYLARGNKDDLHDYIEDLYLNDSASNIDLFYCIGNEALSPVRSYFFEKPVVATNLIKTEDYLVINNKNKIKFAAVRTMPPYDRQLKLLERYKPAATKVGILYTSFENESIVQMESAKKYLMDNNYSVKTYEINNDTNFDELSKTIKNEVDAVYIPVDRYLLNNSKKIFENLNKENIFSIAANHYYVNDGASITLALDYYKAGEETAKMAFEYLVEGFPIEKLLVRDLSLYSNSVYENKNINN